ncbi:MAG: biopolymer transporter ExbD [Saprospirales bacterium]|nr:biopolymer transporter ExbD [Saprospirales bacterium]MBK8490962.1 biopolymer transporter ExbD [Saprospirales bacterium]
MGLKKRSKANAEFSMSSLTDIIFLLLIFFMLTSTLVKIEAFDLPESDSKTVAPTSAIVTVNKSGQYTLNSKSVSMSSLEQSLRSELRDAGNREDYTITIVAEKETPFDRVVEVMQVAGRLKVKTILATQPKKS